MTETSKPKLAKQGSFLLLFLLLVNFALGDPVEKTYPITIEGGRSKEETKFVVCSGQEKDLFLERCLSLEELAEREKKVSRLIQEIINEERSFRGLIRLERDQIAQRVAQEQANYLIEARELSHYGKENKNPDQRYSALNGTGRLQEIVDGFFAKIDTETEELEKISFSSTTADQLIDSILQTPDKKEVLLDPHARGIGIALRLSPDQKQLVVVTEVTRRQGSLKKLPSQSPPIDGQTIEGVVSRGYKFAWLGISYERFPRKKDFQLKIKPYFPPVDRVLYLDMSNRRLKKAAAFGVTLAGMLAAPFTYGLSMIAAGAIQSQISKIYQNHEVEIRKGVDLNFSGDFSAEISLGEYGRGIYYVNLWAYERKSKEVVLLASRTVDVM